MRLGSSDVCISRVVLGCAWRPSLSEVQVHRIVHASVDAGITSFDTAPLYAFHESEQVLGRALRGRREVQILTKAGLRWDGEHGRVLFEFVDAHGSKRAVRKDSRPARLRDEVDASLRRLGRDAIDLLQIHHPDPDTPIADSMQVLEALRREGKIRAIGVSNFSPSELEASARALGGGLDALQCQYSLLHREPERELLPRCLRAGISVLAYSPLAGGVLAGGRGHGLSGLVARKLLVGPALDELLGPIARRAKLSAAAVALAWLLQQPAVTAVVMGASSVEQALANAAARGLELTPAELEALSGGFVTLRKRLDLLELARKLPGAARAAGFARRVVRKLERALATGSAS